MLNSKSLNRLEGVNSKLVAVAQRAYELSEIPFIVTEGIRTKERQAVLVAKGASQTMNSLHITGRAIDVAPLLNGEVKWDWPLFYKLNDAFQKAAKELNVKVEWGGNWKKFPDGPHFQLGVDE